ncbi:ATP-binding protein [Treponema zuelzerae]|uniref:ATP-binding protein n=1 Tax=Teretinema zuelzerae TaxID=156 RepID=A0AAE3JK06_9SPIR|nr:ATP-binding protein [Teretinema zuelzerae]MCD1653519.1 ATP-binding protein [Teretinema zuelzerae]
MKELVSNVDATPSKRLYLSIIADYDINKALSELIDNSLDIWKLSGKDKVLNVLIDLDKTQQRILVKDNAGGISENDLSFIVSPGQSKNNDIDNTIGVFGVGSKRSVVALAQEVRIKTRKSSDCWQIEFDDTWIKESDDWTLPVYKIEGVEKGSTEIELLKLRKYISDEVIVNFIKHVSETYAIFLKNQNLSIVVNGKKINPILFENWAFPPDYPPHNYVGELPLSNGRRVDVLVTAGLTLESNQASGEYGVYLYCNDRLIVKGLKNHEVGFQKGIAGLPHADLSLARVIIQLSGIPSVMPWNSSKSDINTSSEVFISLREWLTTLIKDFTSLSRRFSKVEGGWPVNVFQYNNGSFIDKDVTNLALADISYLPPLPEVSPRYANIVQKKNKTISEEKPWVVGLYESVIAVDWILKQHFAQKNRIALILLDSTIEIAFKEYILNESGQQYSEKKILEIFSNRSEVERIISESIKLTNPQWTKVKHYYQKRCDLIHRKATTSISDFEISDFRKTVESILKKMFKLQFEN